MLLRLLRTYLRPYRTPIVILLVLQLVQTIATLYLPSLNADIIDKGVTQGDTAYIMRTGGVMLVISLGQVICAIVAVYFGAKVAMSFGRDVRGGLFTRVQSFSAQEMGVLGAPSLITRTTNDVQQVQMVVLMTFTFLIMAPIMLIGGVVMALHGRRRAGAIAGGALMLAGAMATRWSVYKAGFQSAADPKYVVGPQRARRAARR